MMFAHATSFPRTVNDDNNADGCGNSESMWINSEPEQLKERGELGIYAAASMVKVCHAGV